MKENILKSQIQKQALEILKQNNFIGTAVLEMGSGKGKLGIDCIKELDARNVLITFPRTNLKKTWYNEIREWFYPNAPLTNSDRFTFLNTNFTLETINTVVKWSKEEINKYDFIICDEVHLIATKGNSKLIIQALELDKKIIGLTGTPNLESNFKKEFYNVYLPIVFEYYDSAKDGLINKKHLYIFKYDLNNNTTIQVKTKNKSWNQGELARYNYIQNTFESSKSQIEQIYFNSIIDRFKRLNNLKLSYKKFFTKILSKDLQYFRNIYWNSMKAKKMPIDLYRYMRILADTDYAKFGMKADYFAKAAPKEAQSYFYKYIWARDERINFLNTLESSKNIALQFKTLILSNPSNKVLLFSELTSQCELLSKNSVHSKKKEPVKQELISKFDLGEIRDLSAIRSLSLGLNLKGANWAIVESFNGSKTDNKQKLGRLHRLDVDNIANVIIIIPKNTQAEEWFNSSFDGLEYKEINSLNEFITISNLK